MPFCSKCGAAMDIDDLFCRACGAKNKPIQTVQPVQEIQPVPTAVSVTALEPVKPVVSTAPVMNSPIALQQQTRTETIEEMNRMIRHFKKVESYYNEYDDCIQRLAYLNRPGVSVRYTGGTRAGKYYVFASILLVFGVILSLIVAASNPMSSSGNESVAAFLILIILWGAAIGLFVKGRKTTVNNRALMAQEKSDQLDEAQKRFAVVCKTLDNHYQKYGYCAVGASYTNPLILQKLLSIISLGRADTIKEAINVMIQDTHNSEMELQARMTARSAASAARGAKAAAFFTAADFFLK